MTFSSRLSWVALLLPLACAPTAQDPGPAGPAAPRTATEWSSYGGDPGGQRYAALDQITPENVGQLEVAWTYHTGDVSDGSGEIPSTTAFQNTPLLVDGTLYVCSPFNRVIALDPLTGAERWVFDPEIDLSGFYANQLICRGISTWLDPTRAAGEPCRRRLLMATNDARLMAIDATSGSICSDFGEGGEVDLNPAAGEQRWKGEYQVTSPPGIVGDVVVVASAIGDNQRWNAPSGVVRGFDIRSGALRWAFDMAPPGYERTPENTSEAGYALGTANSWAPMSVDEELGLVFVPTGNPMLDYYRGHNPTLSHYGSSVIALRGATGEVVWHFQTVHNDLWDFDVPAQPTLTTMVRDGVEIPALVQATKMGILFILNRETGEPLFEIEERPVPQGAVPGEVLSPTQPFPVKPPPLVPHELGPDDAWGLLYFDKRWCRNKIETLRNEGIYTPPSEGGSIMYPGNAGGSNWGGVAVDPERQVIVANTMDIPWLVALLPREEFERTERDSPIVELSPQDGTPYGLRREIFLSPIFLPCKKPPWGTLAAIDLPRGEILWQRPIGTVTDLVPIIHLPIEMGVGNVGGPLVTKSGLVFLGATQDDYLRAFDIESGEELFRGRLPAGGQASPMSYETEGRQFVVIAAGGHARAVTTLGDAVVAFALPE